MGPLSATENLPGVRNHFADTCFQFLGRLQLRSGTLEVVPLRWDRSAPGRNCAVFLLRCLGGVGEPKPISWAFQGDRHMEIKLPKVLVGGAWGDCKTSDEGFHSPVQWPDPHSCPMREPHASVL